MANIIDKQKEIITSLQADSRLSGFNIDDHLINEYKTSSIVIEPEGNVYKSTNENPVVIGYKFSVYLIIKTNLSSIQANRDTLDDARSYVLDNLMNVKINGETDKPSEAVSLNNRFSLYLLDIELPK